MNALRHLLQLRDEQCQKLFEKLIQALEQDCSPLHPALLRGMYFPQLKRLAVTASQWCILGRVLTFQARPLRLKRHQRTLPHLWAALDQELGPACVAVVGITGATDHWCVIHRVTAKTLWLLDSAGRTRIRRSRCTVRASRTRYCLELGEILLGELSDLRVGEAAHDQVHLTHTAMPGAIQDLPAACVESGAAASRSAHDLAPI